MEFNERQHLEGHDAFDPGAADLSFHLSESLECVAMHANWSRLIIDPSQPIASDRLVPLNFSDGSYVSWNKDGYDLNDRLTFYLHWHKLLAEMIWFLDPALVLAIESHQCSEGVRATPGLTQSLLPHEEVDATCYTLEGLKRFHIDRELQVAQLSVHSDFL